jgi:hypothetical protein
MAHSFFRRLSAVLRAFAGQREELSVEDSLRRIGLPGIPEEVAVSNLFS